MARLSQHLEYRRPSQLHLDRKPRPAEEDEYSILDENILDSSSADMSLHRNHRRESFADSVSTFSPTEAEWSAYPYGAEHVTHQLSNNTMHSFHEHSGVPFSKSESSTGIQYPAQMPAWQLSGTSGTSGSCTPTAGYEAFVPEYDTSMAPSYSNGSSLHQNTYDDLHVRTAPLFPQNTSLSTSPQSAKDWMSASSSEQIELRAISKHTGPQSPSFHGTTSPFLRRDGIRKKNARFEIPAERNLRTIDHLINQTNDEHEIKELKQQKRLLRNKQAACVKFHSLFLVQPLTCEYRLDSRQRKKQHTERLEEEKKHFTTIISELEEALGEMKVREVEWTREKDGWCSTEQQYKQYINTLVADKEELVHVHTIDAAELRKKNTFLSEQLQTLESTAMSAAPSSTGYSAEFSDFDHLTMNSSPWDNFSLVNDFSIEAESQPQTQTSLTTTLKVEKHAAKDDDKAATSGLLLMLLLCGAWMASHSSSTSAISLPLMSEDVRLASASVLEHIYKDAGVHLPEAPSPSGSTLKAIKTSPPQSPRKTTLSAFEIASLSHSPLSSLHRQLISPNAEQQRDQIFSLTAKQYNSISSEIIFDHDTDHEPSRRRTLGDALDSLRTNGAGTAAEIYTRSLMRDKVPTDVIKDFSRMVSEANLDRKATGLSN